MPELVAVVSALVSALLLGLASVADQRSTKQVQSRRALSPRIFVDLARRPLWLIAIAANIAGFALQVVALSFGSIALVQPLLVCDLIFAVVILGFLRRRSDIRVPGGRRKAVTALAGVAAATIGIAGFLAIGRPSAGHIQVSFATLPPLAIGFAAVVGGCLTVAARSRKLQPLALALACGVSYGVAAYLVKLVTSEFGGGLGEVFTSWPVYVFAVVGPLGYLLNQNAFQQGTLLAPVQAIITSADPVISIALGIAWLHVRLRGGPPDIAGEIVSILLIITGIVITARYSRPVKSAPGPQPGTAEPACRQVTAQI
jgi:hypothetical protein